MEYLLYLALFIFVGLIGYTASFPEDGKELEQL